MKTMSKLAVVSMLVSAVFFLVSCGGDGGGGTTTITPSGSGSVTLNPVTKVITGTFTTTNVVNASFAHIHDGDVGVAGGIVVGLLESPPGTWSVPANTILNDAQIARLRAGGYYVNVHTTLNPAGEIRGQLGPASATGTTFNATLNLAQEVPAPIPPA